jgi:glutamin-(asparagin-)ase
LANRARTSDKPVALIGTGGTIAGVAPDPDRPHAYTDSQLGIGELVASLSSRVSLPPTVCEQLFQTGSEDFTEAHWLALAMRVQALLVDDGISGVVVAQGTDTIEETAYFLHLLLKSDKPVVVTGAMRPESALGSDVGLNLVQALTLAAHPKARGLGALVMMNQRIHSAREVVKEHTWALDAFKTPEFGPLGVMLDGAPVWLRQPTRGHTRDTPFALPIAGLPRIDLVWGHVGIRPDVIDASVRAGARGLVYAGTGNGSVATQMMPVLREAAASGCRIVRASRVQSGLVVRDGAEDDSGAGFIAAGTLPAVKARVLLQLALTLEGRTDLQALFDRY